MIIYLISEEDDPDPGTAAVVAAESSRQAIGFFANTNRKLSAMEIGFASESVVSPGLLVSNITVKHALH